VNGLGFRTRVHSRAENGAARPNRDERISIDVAQRADRVPFTTRYGSRRVLPGTASKLGPMMLGAIQVELR
jgi:hypothetical protein